MCMYLVPPVQGLVESRGQGVSALERCFPAPTPLPRPRWVVGAWTTEEMVACTTRARPCSPTTLSTFKIVKSRSMQGSCDQAAPPTASEI